MSRLRPLRRLKRDERGGTLIEYAVAVALFLLLFFALIDFGRLLHSWVMAEKGMQIAARMAAVRPAVCPGLPEFNQRGGASGTPRFGTSCDAGANICAGDSQPPTSCSGTAGGRGAAERVDDEIWRRIKDALPPNARISNLQFTYSYDRDLNFLGGPYVPIVTVELRNLDFEFVSPLFALAVAAGAGTTEDDSALAFPFPSMSVSLPGEDLALGIDG